MAFFGLYKSTFKDNLNKSARAQCDSTTSG